MSVLPEIPDESEDVADGQADDGDRDSCAEIDTLPPREFFGRFEARVREGTHWLNARTRLWFDEAKRRTRIYMEEHGFKIKSFALGFRDGKIGIWMTFFRENWSRVRAPSFLHVEEGGNGPFIRAWASIKGLGSAFKMIQDEKEVEAVKREADAAMADIGEEIGRILEQVRSPRGIAGGIERMRTVGRRMDAIRAMVKRRCKKVQTGDGDGDEGGSADSAGTDFGEKDKDK